jgi:hypothetical protein
MSISVDAEKNFGKIQHPFLIRAQKNLGIEGTHDSIMKAVYNKPTAKIIQNQEKTEGTSSTTRNEKSGSTLSTLISYSD